MNNLDLNKLEQKLDDALSNETSESLTNGLEEKKMTNNKAREYTSPLIEELLKEIIRLSWKRGFLKGYMAASITALIICMLIMTITQ